MKSTISTKDLKSKLDQKQVTVVETLAPERYREAHIPGALNIPPVVLEVGRAAENTAEPAQAAEANLSIPCLS